MNDPVKGKLVRCITEMEAVKDAVRRIGCCKTTPGFDATSFRQRLYDLHAECVPEPVPDTRVQEMMFCQLLEVQSMYFHIASSRHFATFIIMRYALKILRNVRGCQFSVMEYATRRNKMLGKFGAIVVGRSDMFLSEQIPSAVRRADCRCSVVTIEELRATCLELSDLYKCLTCVEYVREKCARYLGTYKEELMARACHPSRVAWWMAHDEYSELFGA